MAKKHANVDFINSAPFDSFFSDPKIAPTEIEIELASGDGDIKDIPLKDLYNYHNHTYRVLDDEDMAVLVDSIKDYGIILPLIVREIGDEKYEIVSGHRRKFAAEKLGLETVPCKIQDLSDDMADIVMADTNIARETILPSEKARTYKLRLEAAVRMGKKSSDELKNIAKDSPDSLPKIRRYLKLNNLTNELLNRIDQNRMPVTVGVMLADLPEEKIQIVSDVVEDMNLSPTLKDAENIMKVSVRDLNEAKIRDILIGELKTRKIPKRKVFSENMLSEVVPKKIKKLPLSERIDYYKEAIRFYEKNHVNFYGCIN